MRIKLSIAAVLAVLMALAGVTLASADNGGSSDFTVYTTTDQEAFIDVEPKNEGDIPTLGDQSVFSDSISEERGGPEIGTDHVVCTVTRLEPVDAPTSVTSLCSAAFLLPDGQITVQGAVTFEMTGPPTSFDVPVTGGTGDYEGAEGHITIED